MKIGFTGSGSTGKTTLVNACRTDPKFKDYKFHGSIAREVYKEMGYNSEMDQYSRTSEENFELEMKIQERKLQQQNEIMSNNYSIISDRILLDHYAYCLVRNTSFITNDFFDIMHKKVIENIKQYDIIVYFQPFDKITKDKFRDSSKIYTYLVDNVICDYVHTRKYSNTSMTMGKNISTEDRLEFLKKIV